MSALLSRSTGRQPADGVAAVGKAAIVLRTFTRLTPTLSLRQLEARTGIPRSTLHGLCRALAGAELLESVPQRGYRLGAGLVDLGGQVIDRTGLVEAAEGVLERVPRRDGTEAHLGQLVGGWIVYLDRSSGVIRVPMDNRVGQRVLAHATGCGRAALSALSIGEARSRIEAAMYAERRELSKAAVDALLLELRRARERGFVISSTFQAGRLSVAAPVLGADDTPVGGLSIAGPESLFDRRTLARTADAVVLAARRVSGRLPARR